VATDGVARGGFQRDRCCEGIAFANIRALRRRGRVPGPTLVRIVFCDRHRLFAESFAHVLETLGHDVCLVASPDEVVEAVSAEPTGACLIELEFGDHRGLAALQEVRSASPETRVVVLYGAEDPRLLELVLRAGVTGVISKEQGLENVSATLARLMNGASRGRAPIHFSGFASRRSIRSPQRGISDLTPRERDALRLLALGHGTGALALALGVSYSTARTHIQNVLAKLEVHSRLEAVALLHRQEAAAGLRHVRLEHAEAGEPSRPHEDRMAL
jgi:two-component system, NarL family, nitrate/nitrite response regulator NarL